MLRFDNKPAGASWEQAPHAIMVKGDKDPTGMAALLWGTGPAAWGMRTDRRVDN